MPRRSFNLCLLVACFSFVAFAARAQEVVHAVSGTVSSINKPANTITIKTDDGSEGLFKISTKHVSLDFDDKIRNEATPADSLTKTGACVIVYYFGGGFGTLNERTVVALHDLGPGPFEQDNGTVVNYEKHHRLLKIKTNSGTEKVFHIGDKAVAETALGAVEADKYDPEAGDQVRVIAEKGANGSMTATYLRAK
jgi:hypothetical protein